MPPGKGEHPFEIQEVRDLQFIHDTAFPAELNFRQLLVTGPPGSGKSTLVERIGGWPQEGYIDLAMPRWWTSQMLSLRPREVHLGFPFVGFADSLTVFDREWEHADNSPLMDVSRMLVPPCKHYFFNQDWRAKYVFEFLLPEPETVFASRQERARRRSHRVDEDFDLGLIERQLEALWVAARFLHGKGLSVHIRTGIEGSILRFNSAPEKVIL